MRYIELNPIREGMVSHPGEYRWSCFAHNAIGSEDELFCKHIEDSDIQEIREALTQELVLGRGDFKRRIEEMSHRQTRPGQPGRPWVREPSAIYYVI